MTPNTHRRLVAVAILSGAIGLSGCSAVKAANTIRHDVDNNRATISSFTTQLKSSAATPFEATYVTTGANPTTVVYAVSPPTGVAFTETPTNKSTPSVNIIVNSNGEYSCSGLNCQKLPAVDAQTENKIFDFYTPSHWVTFLRDFSLAAGFAGDKVTSSTKTVNGFSMNCVDFKASGVPGTSTICSTSQGILGYVKVASDKTRFEIKSYTASPSSSLFQLPAGAKVTKVTLPSTSPSPS
jgi:hypothetical protein